MSQSFDMGYSLAMHMSMFDKYWRSYEMNTWGVKIFSRDKSLDVSTI